MALSYAWDEEDIRWLRQLAEKVPLAQGRMEIHSSLFAIGWRLGASLAFIVVGGAGVVTEIRQGAAARLPMFAFFSAIGAAAAWPMGQRLWCFIRRRPEFVLSRKGITINGRLLSWQEVHTAELDCINMRSYRSYSCKIALRNGQRLSLDLDTVSLSRQRIMLLMDFYATGARRP